MPLNDNLLSIEELTRIPRALGLHELSCHYIRIGVEAMERA
jgi:hypothetical protein